MRVILSLFIALLFIAPSAAHAAADLKILAEDIRFSKDTLIAGDEVRIYGKITNVGDVDTSGFATFYQGANLLGDSQVISLISGGNPEEVWVDVVVPTAPFNIQAQIKGTDPEDSNTSNNTALTGMFTPVLDDDRDGVENGADNCPSVGNADQTDSDGDGQGDMCDNDDDNDGLSDAVEAELGSSTTSADSDGDGVPDADDAFPTDPTKTKIEDVPPPPPAPEPVAELFEDLVSDVADSIQTTVSDEPTEQTVVVKVPKNEDTPIEELTDGEDLEEVEITFSPNAVFAYRQNDWNTFTFSVVSPPDDDTVYEWSFGDGVRSGRTSVTHSYQDTGSFTVTLATTDAEGKISKESTVILIPFFSLENKVILFSIALLVILLILGIVVIMRTGKKLQDSLMMVAADEEEEDEEEEIEEEPKPKKVHKKKPRAKKIKVKDEDNE